MVGHRSLLVVVAACVAIYTVFGCPTKSLAQEADRFGVLGGYDIDIHNAEFAKLTTLGYCCPVNYGSIQGSTLYGGLGYELPTATSLGAISSIGFSIGYQQRVVTGIHQASTYINDPATNQGLNALINYTQRMQRSDVFVEINPRVSLSSAVKFTLGAKAAYSLSSQLSQREELPDDLVKQGYYFIDAATQTQLPYRNIYEGAIPTLRQITVALQAGLTLDVPLNHLGTTILTPGVWYRYQPNGFASSTTSRIKDPNTGAVTETAGAWSIQSAGVSLSLAFSPKPTVELDPCQTIIDGRIVDKKCPEGKVLRLNPATSECGCVDTVIIRMDTAIVTLNSMYGLANGVRSAQPLQQIDVIRSPRTIYLPITYGIVFNTGSSNIDLVNRYIDIGPERKSTFYKERSFARLYQRHVLNVIGSKFAEGSASTLTIVGFADPSEPSHEALALERAVKVREHLYRRWGIPLAAFTVRVATVSERAIYAGQFSPSTGNSQALALVFLNGSNSVVDYVSVTDKFIRVNPQSIVLEANVDLGPSATVASLDYQMRLGGATGGKMVQPVRTIYNAGDASFLTALKEWTLPLSGPGAAIESSLHALPNGESSKLIPTLRVTSSSGQVIEAQRDNQRAVLPVRVIDNDNTGRSKDDSTYASIAYMECQQGSVIQRQQQQALQDLLKKMRTVNAAATVDRYDSRAQTNDKGQGTGNHESVGILRSTGIGRIDQQVVNSPVVEREDPLGMNIHTILFVRTAVP
jgi:hypothetical protein